MKPFFPQLGLEAHIDRYSFCGGVSINTMTEESLRHGKKFCKPYEFAGEFMQQG
jgi:hypothetical protein